MDGSPQTVLELSAPAAWLHIDQVAPWGGNPKFHPDEQIERLANMIRALGWGAPMIVHVGEEFPVRICAGHGRRLALELILQETPDFVVPGAPGPGFLPARPHVVSEFGQVRFATWAESADYAVGEDKIAEYSAWDRDALAVFMEERVADRELEEAIDEIERLMAFDEEEIRDLLRTSRAPPERAEVSDPGTKAKPKIPDSRIGQVYELGEHRLICGDARELGALERGLEGMEEPILVCADPPYGMGKESEGVLNDNARNEELDRFNCDWWTSARAVSAENASCYIWGLELVLFRFWFIAEVYDDGGDPVMGLRQTDVTYRNLIDWRKPDPLGVNSPEMRQYPTSTERCLFFMRGKQAIGNVNKDDYWDGFDPIREYQAEQFAIMGWGPKQVHELLGIHMFGHWTTKCQWALISQRQYERLQEASGGKAFQRPWHLHHRAYKALTEHPDYARRREHFFTSRAPFDNTHARESGGLTDVWDFQRVEGEERHGHATPKPVELCERMVKTSSRPGDVVLVPFGGSGPDLIACARQGRRAVVVELDPGWCDVIRDRYTRWARQAGVDPGPGALELNDG